MIISKIPRLIRLIWPLTCSSLPPVPCRQCLHPVYYSLVQMSITFMFCRVCVRATRLETKTRFALVHLSRDEYFCSSFCVYPFLRHLFSVCCMFSSSCTERSFPSTYGHPYGIKMKRRRISLYTCKLDVQSSGRTTHGVYSRIPLVPEPEVASFCEHEH